MLIPDSCFYQGSTHAVCQDYAGTVRSHKLVAAAISDGCSSITETDATGKSTTRPNPHSDIGARILALSALSTVQHPIGISAIESFNEDLAKPGQFKNDRLGDIIVMNGGDAFRGFRGMDIKALDATLGLVVAEIIPGREKQSANCFLWGDGAIIHRNAAGEVVVWHQEYVSGAPYYLSYRLSGSRTSLYRANHDKDLIETRAAFNGALASPDYDDQQQRKRHYSIPAFLTLPLDVGDTIMICSDGLGSFCNPQGPVNWREIVPDITGFKRFSGDYLKARMTFAIRQWNKANLKHADDFSVAAIHNDGQAPDQN